MLFTLHKMCHFSRSLGISLFVLIFVFVIEPNESDERKSTQWLTFLVRVRVFVNHTLAAATARTHTSIHTFKKCLISVQCY